MKSYSLVIHLSILFCFLLNSVDSIAQCPNASFTVPSAVCSGGFLQFNNTSTGAASYQWDFSPGFFNQTGTRVADTVLNLVYPGDITLVDQNDTPIVFLCGLANANLYRLVYGDGPNNPVTQVDNFGNLGMLYQPSDIALYKEGGNWYGFIVDYGSNYLFRISFGNSLMNTPGNMTIVLTNVQTSFSSPWSIKLNKDEAGNIFGFVCNHTGGSISILQFGNSILNAPTANAPIVVPGTTYVQDAAVVNSCGNWYALLAGNSSMNIIRAEFGNSLLNTPTFSNIITAGSPSDILLISDSSHWKLIYTSFSSYETRKYDLGTDLSNVNPVYLGSDHISGSYPKGICATRRDNNYYIFNLYSSNNVLTTVYSTSAPVNQSLSTDPVPTGIYFTQPGTYPVTLTATGANGNSSTFTDVVTVAEAPTSNFSYANGCLGDNTMFSDSSTVNTGTISAWKWYFGDGDTSAVQNATHTYLANGNFNVSLVTTSSSGCVDSVSLPVQIADHPLASFTYPPATCSLTDLNFIDQSAVNGDTINQWNWDFGNGDFSNLQDPVYSFPFGGSYTITLHVTSGSGCSDSNQVMLSFSDRPQAKFATDSTCVGQLVKFNDQTIVSNSSITNYQWDFGDGNSDIVANPNHQYANNVGLYFAQLIVTAANGCKDTINNAVKINNVPNVNFTINPYLACQNNDVAFTDLSNVSGDTISEWHWDFGDGLSDSIQNPTHKYQASGQFTVTLFAYSPSRCAGNPIQQFVDVQESPIADFNFTPTCDQNSMHFINNSVPAPGSSIDSVIWNFNGLGSSNIYHPDYLFPGAGDFQIKLTVISPEGCVGADSLIVPVHAKPVVGFSNTLPCSGDTIQFTNTSSADSLSNIVQYNWSFGDAASGVSNTSSMQHPAHHFIAAQSYIVSMIATTDFGCSDTSLLNIYVNPSPIVSFNYTPTCKGSLMQFINPGSPTDVNYSWDFGDGTTNLVREPIHNYINDGTYSVNLNVTSNAGCISSLNKNIIVSPIPIANFSTTPTCINVPYTFVDFSTISYGNIVHWDWHIPGMVNPDTISSPPYLFTDTGSINVKLTVTSDIGCSNSITKTIFIYPPPTSSFSFDPQFGNPPLNVNFTDHSIGANSFQWDFGEGSSTDTAQDPFHLFTDTGIFIIKQFVVSQYGCKDSSSKNIYVIHPLLDIAITGDSSYFENNYFNIVCELKNLGTRDIENVQLEAKLENGNTIRETLNEVIPSGPGGYKTYKFHASFLINSANEFSYYCIKAIDPNGESDNIPENNSRCTNLTDETILFDPYPNPFTEFLNLHLLINNSDYLRIDLIDVTGKVVKDIYYGKPTKNYLEITSEPSELRDGVYSLRIYYRDKVFVKYVVKNSRP